MMDVLGVGLATFHNKESTCACMYEKAGSIIFGFLIYLTVILDRGTYLCKSRFTCIVPLLNRMMDSVIEVVTISKRVSALNEIKYG